MPGKKARIAVFLLFSILCMFSAPFPGAQAAENTAMAEDISSRDLIADTNCQFYRKGLFDKVTTYSYQLKEDPFLLLRSEKGMGSLYFVFGRAPGEFTVTDPESGAVCTFGQKGFLHEFVDLEAAFGKSPEQVRIEFSGKEIRLNEIRVYTSGQVPDSVQRWEEPADQETDLLLFSTHGDDEQIFFAGLLPYYAGELGYQVQVVYLTDHHNNTAKRIHEMLDGLWAVGVKNYPVFGTYGDYYSDSLEKAYQKYKAYGITEEELLSFVVEQLRRFRPKVAVGHDLAGEYGHGMHMLYADLLCKAVEISDDPAQYPETAEKYGLWDVPKTYLHLYEENPIHMNWDIPLEAFDGMTAYEVTRDLGFPCHVSQRSAYAWYFRGSPTAETVDEYSCCDFGLYRSTVGEDVEKNDFFENLTTYAEDAVLEAELIAAEEARQQKQAEEKAKAEEAEAAARAQEEAKREQARLEKARQEAQAQEQQTRTRGIAALPILCVAVLGAVFALISAGKRAKK